MTRSTMESLYKVEMLAVSLNLYEFIGETKITVSKKNVLFRILNWIILCIALAYIAMNFLYIEGEYYVKTLQSLFYLSQPLLKYVLLAKQKPTIQTMLWSMLKGCWNYRSFGERITRETERIHKTVRYAQLAMIFGSLIALNIYLLRPLIVSTSGMPLESYIPQSVIMDAIVMLSQFYCVWLSVITVIGYDFIYVSTCIQVILQLKLVKLRMQQALNSFNEASTSVLHICIKHHQFLLSVFFCMRNIYSILLLYHYLTTLVSTCTVILQLFLRQSDAATYATNIIGIVFLVSQFALYTFPAEQVATEFSDISNTIYTSKWYQNDRVTQKLVLFIMMKSQQRLYFTGAGLVDINAEAFEAVIRKSFSFGAIVKNLLQI